MCMFCLVQSDFSQHPATSMLQALQTYFEGTLLSYDLTELKGWVLSYQMYITIQNSGCSVQIIASGIYTAV